MTQLSLYFGMLMLTANFSSTASDTPNVPVVQQATPTAEEQRFVDLVNYERWWRGENQLTVDPKLVEASRAHSREMGEMGYFDHHSPTAGLETAMDRYLALAERRPSWAYLGENLFYCSITDVNRGHDSLMKSAPHQANILNPKFERIGVGVYKASNGEFWVTQMFLAKTD